MLLLWYTHQDAVTLFLYKWGVSYFRLDVPSNGLETQKESKTKESYKSRVLLSI